MAFINSAPVAIKSTFCSTYQPSNLTRTSYHRKQCTTTTKLRRARILPVTMDLAGTGIYDSHTKPSDVRVVIFGATGYIGRYVTFEFIKRGYEVIAFARDKSGVGGKNTRDKVHQDFKGATVVFGDVTKEEDVGKAFEFAASDGHDGDGDGDGDATTKKKKHTIVVSCLASRSGGIKDSNLIDYQASLNTLTQASLKLKDSSSSSFHYILLSAICVQKPELEFQRAKLKFENALQHKHEQDESFSYSIVRPTAFFKSLAGQVERMKKGSAFIMFGDGDLCTCNALSERDLASFMVECAYDESKRNQILPVGGPGAPVTPKEQADMLFKILGRKPKYIRLPISIMDWSIGLLDGLASVFPALKDGAEFGRIGKYYAVEDMVGPEYGNDTLQQFFEKAAQDGGLDGQDLGDAAIF